MYAVVCRYVDTVVSLYISCEMIDRLAHAAVQNQMHRVMLTNHQDSHLVWNAAEQSGTQDDINKCRYRQSAITDKQHIQRRIRVREQDIHPRRPTRILQGRQQRSASDPTI